ncbi:MAG: hypothetical protein NZO58_07460, partial [Gemmataceae bacterium]|nr:hypothetical protein [Gemmataceae bacterium]
FLEALAAYVRQGRSLVIFAGDNVDPDAYNRVLGKQLGLLPLPLAGREQRAAKDPLVVNRSSAQLPAFAEFKDDDHYRAFGMFYVWKTLVFAEPEAPDEPNDAAAPAARRDAPVVVFRYSNGKPAVVARKVDAGEVVVIGTAAEMGRKPSSGDPDWTDWQKEGHYGFVPFVQVLMGYLLQRQSQPLNLVAGEALRWHPSERQQRSFTLVHPDGTSVRLGQPTTVSGRPVVVAQDLLTAGIYRLRALLPAEATAPTDAGAIDKAAVLPLAVVPDLQESDDLTSLSNDEIDERLGFRPRHVLASAETTASVLADHLNREWTTWVLLAVLLLVVGEGVLAWWCGRAW